MAGPMRPGDAAKHKANLIPQEVFDTYDTLIAQNLGHGSATVYLSDLVDALIAGGLATSFDDAQKKGYLDVEDVYRQNGWTVRFEKPGFNEGRRQHFVFTDPQRGR